VIQLLGEYEVEILRVIDYPGFRALHFFKELVKDEGRKTG